MTCVETSCPKDKIVKRRAVCGACAEYSYKIDQYTCTTDDCKEKFKVELADAETKISNNRDLYKGYLMPSGTCGQCGDYEVADQSDVKQCRRRDCPKDAACSYETML